MTTPPQRSADEWAAAVARGGLDPQSLTLAGYALAQAQRTPEAVQVLLQALALKPDFVPAHTGLAGCLAQEGLHREAAEAFRTAHLLDPRRVGDLAHALFQLRSACAWEGLEAEMALLRQEIGRSDATHRVDPFAAMALGLSPADQRRAAERWAAEVRAKAGAALPSLRWQWDGQRPLRVGYLGADFYSHATLWLCIGLLEAHDRQRFDITLYDHGRSDRSELAPARRGRGAHRAAAHTGRPRRRTAPARRRHRHPDRPQGLHPPCPSRHRGAAAGALAARLPRAPGHAGRQGAGRIDRRRGADAGGRRALLQRDAAAPARQLPTLRRPPPTAGGRRARRPWPARRRAGAGRLPPTLQAERRGVGPVAATGAGRAAAPCSGC
jgi:hypothetical protein